MLITTILLLMTASITGQFTADDAAALAAANHPALEAAGYAVEEAKGEALQAGLPPNPELDVGVEGWKSGNDEGGHELLVGISQTLPISGARKMARKAGMFGAAAATAEAEALRLEVAGAARSLFYETLAAQERLKLLSEAGADADALASLTRIRFEQGDIAEVDLMRAVAEKHRYLAETEKADKLLKGLRSQLAELCGIPDAELPECAGGNALEASMLPDPAELKGALLAHPRGKARELHEAQAAAALKAVRRKAIVEPAVRIGMRRDDDSKDNALDVGISIPLPLFDRNQGEEAEAHAREQRIRAENDSDLRELVRMCLALRAEAGAAIAEAAITRNNVIPQLAAAYAAVEKALELGGVTVFETLAAKRDIAEAQLALIESERKAHVALITLNTLLGR